MKELDLSSMISLGCKVFDIIEKDYKVFLKKDKLSYLLNFDLKKLFKVINKEDFWGLYFESDTYYLNLNLEKEIDELPDSFNLSNYLKNTNLEEIFQEFIIFLVLNLFCGEINPLKMGLMEVECQKISEKYNIKNSPFLKGKEMEIAKIMLESILKDLPFNIIFLDNDTEIFYYLSEEKGIKIAKMYYEVSCLMKEKYKKFSSNFSLKDFFNFYDDLDYSDVLDFIYDFINMKIR